MEDERKKQMDTKILANNLIPELKIQYYKLDAPHEKKIKGEKKPDTFNSRYSASHFSHFLAYLSKSCERSRTTKVNTTLAKNSDVRLSLASAAFRTSAGKAAYVGAIGWFERARVCSSNSCA